MKKLLFTLFMISGLAIQAQITDATYYERTQYGINWLFDFDTVRINRLHIENKTGFDSLGQIFKYTGSTPAAGMLLKGNGATYQNFSKGSAGQFLRVNTGGTDLEWNTFDGGDITGLPDNFVLFGASTGGIDYSSDLQFNGSTFSCQGTGYFDQGLTIGGTGGFSTIFDSQGLISDYYGAVAAGDIFYGVTGGGLMMRLPLGTANQVLKVKSDASNLEWVTSGLVQAPTELTGQNASIAATTAYTTPASDGYYRITITATVTTAAGSSLDLAVQLRYTEATDNVAKTFPNGNVNNYNRTQTNTTAATVSISCVAHVKASTNIQYITSFSSVGGSPAYNLHVTVEKLPY